MSAIERHAGRRGQFPGRRRSLSSSGQETRMMSAPASSQRRIWSIVAFGVGRQGVGHGLHGDRGVAAHGHLAPTMICRLLRRVMSRQGLIEDMTCAIGLLCALGNSLIREFRGRHQPCSPGPTTHRVNSLGGWAGGAGWHRVRNSALPEFRTRHSAQLREQVLVDRAWLADHEDNVGDLLEAVAGIEASGRRGCRCRPKAGSRPRRCARASVEAPSPSAAAPMPWPVSAGSV